MTSSVRPALTRRATELPAPMARTPSTGGSGNPMHGTKRIRTKRGERRGDTNKASMSHQGHAGPEPVVPLKLSANRWVPASTTRKVQPGVDLAELVDRKVKALLNKLTMEKFETISDQIIHWANKSVNEKDGRTLIQVIRLVFEKAIDESVWSEMYARLCRKMMEQISPEVQDDGIKNMEGRPVRGGHLFRKYLLNRCQEDFERGWFAKDATAVSTTAAKAPVNQPNETVREKKGAFDAGFNFDEYHAAQKAKRQGLNLITFIGELFKVRMLTERIMHGCVMKLLGNIENPEEEKIESLCQLLKTVGQLLDTPKARGIWIKSPNVSTRMQFMLQDVIELRERVWMNRDVAPLTIAAVHVLAAKEIAAAEERLNCQMSMSCGGSQRGDDRNEEDGPDGWAAAGDFVPRAPPKAGDLSPFGNITNGPPMTLAMSPSIDLGHDGAPELAVQHRELQLVDESMAPLEDERESAFISMSEADIKKEINKYIPMSCGGPRGGSKQEHGPDAWAAPCGSIPWAPPKADDLSQFGKISMGAPMVRKKIQLLPRSILATEENAMTPSEEESENASHSVSKTTLKKIDEDVKEFFMVRNLQEADDYFPDIPCEHRFRLVDKLVASALESKETDAKLVGDFFAQAISNGHCALEIFEKGFMPMAEFLDDIAIDTPRAFDYMAIMLQGAGMHNEPERLHRIASKLKDSAKLALS
ncbi:armadillo-type protein [Suillus cothurnatus]|nr:armadillo-type protein [Suillus cothurnatus]